MKRACEELFFVCLLFCVCVCVMQEDCDSGRNLKLRRCELILYQQVNSNLMR